MDELPAGLNALLLEARSAHDPRPEDARRVAAALGATIVGFQPIMLDPATAATAGPSSGPLVGFGGVAKSVGLLVVVTAVGGAIATWRSLPEYAVPRSRAAMTHIQSPPVRPSPRPPAPMEPESALVVERDEQTSPSTSVATVERSPRGGSRKSAVATPSRTDSQRDAPSLAAPRPEPASSASEELLLIREATRALRDHRLATARQMLEQHAMRFPAGILMQEREGLTVIALCLEGRLSEARPLRASFLANAPTSPLAARVRSACAGATERN